MRKKQKQWIIGIILAIVLVGILASQGLIKMPFSVISLSNVNLVNGKAFWVLTATADNIDEGNTFQYSPQTYTKTDGTKIEPRQSLSLKVSKENSYCNYQLQKVDLKVLTFWTYSYDILLNPERVANIKFVDGNGKSTSMDATIVQSKDIIDSDGSGKVTITTLGLLASKTDCPNYENVAIITNNDGTKKIVQKTDLDTKYRSIGSLFYVLFSLSDIKDYFTTNVNLNTQFIRGFSSTPSITSTYLMGDINIGNGVFTITADQDYFDSVVIEPPKEVKPVISSVVLPDIQVESSGSMIVTIQNQESSEGTITVKTSSDRYSINPSSTSISLKDSKQMYFNVRAGSQSGLSCIDISVCSVSQFGGTNCDTERKCSTITQSTPTVRCGDNVCQSNENSVTCPEDCLAPIPPPTPEKCSSCDAWARNKLFGGFISSQSCEPKLIALPPQTWLTCWVFILKYLAILPIVLFTILFGQPFYYNLKAIKRNNPFAWILAIISGILMGVIYYFLWWLGLTLLVVYLIFTLIVGGNLRKIRRGLR